MRRIEAAIAAGAAGGGGGTGDRRKASSPASASFAPYNSSRGRPPSRPPLTAAQAQAQPHQSQAQVQPQAQAHAQAEAQPQPQPQAPAQAPAQAQPPAQVPAPMPPLIRNDGAGSGGHPGGSGLGLAAATNRREGLVSRSESLAEEPSYEGRTASRKSSFTSAGRSMVSGGQRGFMGCLRRMGSLNSSAPARGVAGPTAAAPGNVS